VVEKGIEGIRMMKENKKVIVAGHICLDMTPIFPGRQINSIDEILKPGRLLQVGKADVHTGGAVANTGLAMKILGADVSLMGKIGDDEFGNMVLTILKPYGLEASMVIAKGEATSYSMIIAVPGVDRIFLHNCGVNNSFVASDISDDSLRDAALFHFGYPPLMKSIYENNGLELIKMMKHAQEMGVATSLDMASIDPASEAGQIDWKIILSQVLPYVDFFVPSVEELCYMLNRELFEEWQQRASGKDITEIIDIKEEVEPLAQTCLSLGAKIVLVKCGAPGMYYCTADETTLSKISRRIDLDVQVWANQSGFEASYVPDRVLSGTGAGDTSIAAFLTAILDGYSLERCLQLATATGASCVSAHDALSGLKSFEQLIAKIDNGWKKQEGLLC
jgi:sugar/nucleoside kinase (ribokinase family)